MSGVPRTLVGVLKQQFSSSEGLYEWKRHQLRLDITNGIIESLDDVDVEQKIILAGYAQYAKEWAISSPIAGFGFDIVTYPGTILSFIAADDETCMNWVRCINESIGLVSGDVDVDEQNAKDASTSNDDENNVDDQNFDSGEEGSAAGGGEGGSTKPPLYPTRSPGKQQFFSQRDESSLHSADHRSIQETTQLVQQSPEPGGYNRNNSTNTTARYPPHSLRSPIAAMSPSPANPPQPHRSKTKDYVPNSPSELSGHSQSSARPPAPLSALYQSGPSSIASSPPQFDGDGRHSRSSTHGDSAQSHRILEEMLTGAGSLLSQGGSRSLLGASVPGNPFPSSREAVLEHQANRWQATAEREAAEGTIAREQLMRVSAELEARQQQHKVDLEKALERAAYTNDALHVSLQSVRLNAPNSLTLHSRFLLRQSELEMRVLRASNENASFHETALRVEREQAARELTCLRDELQAERKRYSALLQNETAMRDRAEGREVTLLQELAGLKESVVRLTAENGRLRDTSAAEQAAFDRERKILLAEHQARAARLDQESSDSQAKTQVELRQRHSELQLRFESKVKEMEASIRQTIQAEAESARLRADAVAKKKHAAELEEAKLEERKARAREVDQLRESFREREKQTSDDLSQLESLHNDRVRRLDAQNDSLRQRVIEAEKAAKKASSLAAKSSEESRKLAGSHLRQAEINAQRAQELAEQLAAAQRETQEGCIREAGYRDQLGRALEEGRLARAEFLETKRQLQELHQQSQVRSFNSRNSVNIPLLILAHRMSSL